ncbi:hypothetical protein PMAYCL1PPCAC_03414, partial [Pristionchus mayeri]
IRDIRTCSKEDRLGGLSTEAVLAKHVMGAPPHLLPVLKERAVKRAVQRAVEVKGDYKWPCKIDVTLFDMPFLREDTCEYFPCGNENAYKLFATDDGLDTLSRSLDWAVDGTFHSTPKKFHQIFVVGALDDHLFTPLVYAFLSTKTTRSYDLVFDWLAQQRIPMPLTVYCDFERAISNALANSYPLTTINRCWIHWLKNIYKKMKVRNIFIKNYDLT